MGSHCSVVKASMQSLPIQPQTYRLTGRSFPGLNSISLGQGDIERDIWATSWMDHIKAKQSQSMRYQQIATFSRKMILLISVDFFLVILVTNTLLSTSTVFFKCAIHRQSHMELRRTHQDTVFMQIGYTVAPWSGDIFIPRSQFSTASTELKRVRIVVWTVLPYLRRSDNRPQASVFKHLFPWQGEYYGSLCTSLAKLTAVLI